MTPAFNEEANLAAVYDRLAPAVARLGDDWEWIVVDDHSRDETFRAIERVAAVDTRVRGIRLARNSGSHVAITCGLHCARGDAAIVLAADLQDPPELVEPLVARWREGAQIVWAARRARPGGFSALYYWIMRRVVGLTDMPAHGADVFLMDRVALDAFRSWSERNVSVLALVTWLGFRQAQIEYDKQPRAAGQSGWTLARKVRLVVDSVTAFSDLPIRLCGYGGAVLVASAAIAGGVGVVLYPHTNAVFVLLLSAMIGLTGVNLIALGMLGSYVWRVLEQARGRPLYVIERTAPAPSGAEGSLAVRLP